jgi:hypothetical protein
VSSAHTIDMPYYYPLSPWARTSYFPDRRTGRRARRRLPFAAKTQDSDKIRQISNRTRYTLHARVARCYQHCKSAGLLCHILIDVVFVSESPIENLNGWALEKLSLLSGVDHHTIALAGVTAIGQAAMDQHCLALNCLQQHR